MPQEFSFIQKAKKLVFKKIALPKVNEVYDLEDSIVEFENSLKYSEESADRFDIPIEFGKRANVKVPINSRTIKHILSCIRFMKKAVYDLKRNPKDPRTEIYYEELEELQVYANSVKVSAFGFTKVPRNLIFRNKAIVYENAIILAMKMDNEAINTSPSIKSNKNIWFTYDKLSVASVKIARFLRKKGFGAHASPPLGGIALYPVLGRLAGMGEFGYSGILIGPFNGPTFRLAAVYVSAENLPFSEKNDHSWIREYCQQCRRCINECPAGAIYDSPIEHEAGRLTHIDNNKCFPYFGNNHACTVCIKVCPFNKIGYHIIKKNFENQKNRE